MAHTKTIDPPLNITARKKSEERLSVLAKIGQLLASSIDCHLPSLLASILKIAAGSVVADWCVLDIVEERGAIERIATPTALANRWKMIRLSWEQRIDPKQYHMVVELCNGDRVGVESDLSAEDDSFVAFPLAARGKVFGTWLFARHRSRNESRAYLGGNPSCDHVDEPGMRSQQQRAMLVANKGTSTQHETAPPSKCPHLTWGLAMGPRSHTC